MIRGHRVESVERLDVAVLVNKVNSVADDALGVAAVVAGPAGRALREEVVFKRIVEAVILAVWSGGTRVLW